MEGTKPRTANTIGMFDLLKGAGMLVVVFVHTAEYYPFGTSSGLSLGTFLMFTYREALMGAFYIASGYGFRKRSIGKCIRQQCQGLLKPYLYTAFATAALHLIAHYIAFGSWSSALGETYKVLGGFLLGLPHTATYFGQEFFSCGPMWYLLALMIAWIVLDILLNVFPERYIPWAVGGTMLLGWGIALAWEAPFCLAQGLIVVPYLYLGFLAKKYRLFDRRLSKPLLALVVGSAALVAVGVLVTKSTDCVSLAEWTMGPISIAADGLTGLGILTCFLWLRRRLDNPVSHAVEAVGRRSLYIFCIHTVELTAIPWYLLAQKYAASPTLGFLLQFVVSLVSILALTELLVRRRDWRIRAKPSKRRQPAPARPYATKH